MPDDRDRLIDRLPASRVLPDLDAHDIADLLWLCATTGIGAGGVVAAPGTPAVPNRPAPQENAGRTPEPPAAPREPGDLYDGTSTGHGEQRARRVRLRQPQGRPLPLDLARSLRAFDRKWQAGRRWQLDLDASVAGYARTGHLTPVFRAAPERWFEATVLVDDSPSMALWRDTAAGFTALLRQLGAFRSVRTLTLTFDGESPRIRNAAGRLTHPRQLRSATSRRLVLVLSDCLAEPWSGRAVWQTLWDWARSTPTALVNPLPSSLWRRTGLDLPAVRVAPGAVGGANTTLRYRAPWFAQPRDRWLPLPTPALTAQSMRRWANTLMRADPTGADAVLVPANGRLTIGGTTDTSSVESFRHVASEEAFRLAVLGSPHDPVSLRLLDLLRDQLVPHATVSDLAEIIASGVAIAERAGDNTVLRFRPDLRPQLQQLLPAPEAWRVHEILTEYVATHAGTSGELVLAVPDPTGPVRLPADLQPFAEASRNTLRLLGIAPRTPTRPHSELFALLAHVRKIDLITAYSRAAPGAPAPGPTRGDVLQALERLDTGPHELPKPVEFAAHLAGLVDPALAGQLRDWADGRAQELGLTVRLHRLRAEIADWSRVQVEPTGAMASGGGGLWPLVKALTALPSMATVQDRNFVGRLLVDRLGTGLQIDAYPQALNHVFNIVEVADRRPDGLRALLDVVRELDGGSRFLPVVEQIIAERTALPLWPEDEREELFALLRGVIFTDLVELYHQVAGPSAPELPAETTYRDVFLALETLSADPDGLPKPIVFVEYLASSRRSVLAMELRRWVDRQVTRLGLVTELQRMRRELKGPPPGPPPNSPAYLVLQLRRVGLTGDRYQLDHWTQLDLSEGWHPERGEDFTGTLDEVKLQVAKLIEAVETKWARYQPDIRIEMVLSSELLNLDVDQWPWEVESPLPPVPIGCRYLFTVRSLERMQSGQYHRAWHRRWSVLNGHLKDGGFIPPMCGHRTEPGDNIRTLVADFENNPDVVSLVLSEPPAPVQGGGNEVAVGLRAGLPVMVWSRQDCDSEEFLATAEELLHGEGPGDILRRLRQIRTTAYKSHAGHVGQHLAVLWDDPERLVSPGDLGPPRDPREASIA